MISRDPEKIPSILLILKKKVFFIEGMKYCKKLIAHDYLIIHKAQEKAYPQYIMQKKHPLKFTIRKWRLAIHIILCRVITLR